jgi:hypothetical protein
MGFDDNPVRALCALSLLTTLWTKHPMSELQTKLQ